MSYEKQTILTNDRNPNGGDDYEVECPFMVSDAEAFIWTKVSRYGDEPHLLYPAFSTDSRFTDDKGRCWFHSWSWNPASGYTARGYGSELITFEEGVRRMIEGDRFSFELPDNTA